MAVKTCLLITGMHRSGTSLAAESLARLGLPVGESLLQADTFNPRGYFEDAEVVQIHDALLDAMERPWGADAHVLPLPETWQRTRPAQKAARQIEGHLKARLIRAPNAPTIVMKDPRASLFLPLWIKAAKRVNIDLKTVICVRDPGEVAASLGRRDAFPEAMCQALWLQYNATLLRTVVPSRSLILPNQSWSENATEMLEKLALFAGVTGDLPEPVFDAGLQTKTAGKPKGLLRQWVTELAHAATSEGRPTAALIALAQQYHDHAVFLAAVNTAGAAGDAEQSRLVRDLATYREAHDALEREIREQAQSRQDVVAEAQRLTQALGAREQELTALTEARKQESDRFSSEMAALISERDTLYRQAVDNLEAYQAIDARLDDAMAELTRVGKLRDRLEVDLAESRRSEKERAEEIRSLNAKQDTTRRELEVTQADLRALAEQLGQDRARAQELHDDLMRHVAMVDGLRQEAHQLRLDNVRLRRWHVPSWIPGLRQNRQ